MSRWSSPAPAILPLALTIMPTAVRAQPDQPEEDRAFARGVVSTSALYYRERAAEAVPGNELVSPDDLGFADLRARLEVGHVAGGRWGGLADLRLRFTRDELATRGFAGGREYHLREARVSRTGERLDLTLGRQVMREVDAMRVDGAALRLRPRDTPWEYGLFAGLYPDPLSRSLAADYRRDQGGPPAAAGVYAAYNTRRNHGGLGLAGISPRGSPDPGDPAAPTAPDPLRLFATSSGYHVVGDTLDLFHYVVADLAGPSGAQLLSAHLGANWRTGSRLRIEAGFSRMSTHAVELYVRDLLETPDPEPASGAPIQNNLALVRIASKEGRAGMNLALPARVDLHGQVRVRERDALFDAALPMEIAALAPDIQTDLSAGLRHWDSLLGLDLSATIVAIRGARTANAFATLRARRALWDGRLDAELEAGAVGHVDRCAESLPTCTGRLSGRTLRAGGQLVFLPAPSWLLLADYRFARSTTERSGTEQPTIRAQLLFLRAQRSF